MKVETETNLNTFAFNMTPCAKCTKVMMPMDGSIRSATPPTKRRGLPGDGIPVCTNPRCTASVLFTRA